MLWFSDDRDGFVRDEAGRLLTAATAETLTAVARSRDITPVDCDPAGYDLDRIRAWCSAPEASAMNCPALLDAWNFFDDMAGMPDGADTPRGRRSRGATACYEKLFWGSNLPAVTPPGERFAPEWRADELIQLRSVLEAGLDLVESELRAAGVRV
ncbi:hypothetical protein [Paludisphaera sp.]|uniref:hypothetical protein n=1 Tax=Paludisphaera sp. TaxID=2017432 RepID=UPI00301D0F10